MTIGFKRKIFFGHGIQDNVLTVNHARRSKEILETIKAEITYKEYDGGHVITELIMKEAKNWPGKKTGQLRILNRLC